MKEPRFTPRAAKLRGRSAIPIAFDSPIVNSLTMFARAFSLLVASLALSHAEKPVVYNPIQGKETARDKAAAATLSSKYSVIEIPQDSEYTNPRFTAGSIPKVARTPDGKFLGGQVSMGCVITEQGQASDVRILESSDEKLDTFVLDAVKQWHFAPATYKGKPASIVAGGDFEFQTPPTEFVTQILEPTGGKIDRPKDWFYSESGSKGGYLWTISKEDPAKGKRYLTGVRIQLIAGVRETTGKSPEEFIRGFIESKEKKADKVLESCEPKEQYLFTRVCLETEEGPFHILYSLFWCNDDLDMAVVVTAGAPKDLWEVYSPAFDRMSAFELIDMKRFDKKETQTGASEAPSAEKK